jgi:anaerobic magnesium-protoporphyrin IX monomethyl ester cyclase
MRILLINIPHPSIGSRIRDDHLPPLPDLVDSR